MALDIVALRSAITAIATTLEVDHERLTALDGELGDGDLGITLLKAFRSLKEAAPELPSDLGGAFQASAMVVNKASSSSFGTLMAVAFLAVSKSVQGKTEVPWSDISPLLTIAIDTMSKRGRANLGDKTVLDAIAAVADATAGLNDADAILAAARSAAAMALDRFRDAPCKVGRARIFAERTIGMDDPGMAAFKTMVDALADRAAS